MDQRMNVPSFVRRTTVRIAIGGLVAMAVVAALGFAIEQRRFGRDAASARARIEADVQEQFAALSDRLNSAVRALTSSPLILPAGETPDAPSVRALFERVGVAESRAGLPGLALTVVDPDGQPIAWSNRPGVIPAARINGPPALFLAPSPLGLRLVRVEPVLDPADGPRRLCTVVAETTLPRGGGLTAVEDSFVMGTSVVPVNLRLPYEDVASPVGSSIEVVAPGGAVLATIDVPERVIAQARTTWRARVTGAVLGAACVTVLLFLGPVADLRRLAGRPGRHIELTLAMIGLVVLARRIAWSGLEQAGLASLPLGTQVDASSLTWPLLASPLDFLITSLGAAAIAAVLAAAYEQWRQRRWLPVTLVADSGTTALAAFVGTQVVAGAAAGGLIASYEAFLGGQLSQAPVDILHFALHPWDLDRVAVAIGLVVLHAAVLASAVLLLRVGAAPWIVAGPRRALRFVVPLVWLGGGLAVVLVAGAISHDVPSVPAALAVGFATTAAWTLGRYRTALRHASQATRLTAMFLMLALPSIVFYPSLVEAASRARRHLIETRYASEVVNQRRDLQLHLREAMREIDALSGIDDLIEAAGPTSGEAPPSDAAFLVWSQTVLADQRLTSSVELFDPKGGMVSRFALKLPDTTNSPGQETKCTWDVFEEVSPFFSEERKLLHAGRAICREGASGRGTVAGSITLHVMLDYGNLSFISAQSPYVALLRSPDAETIEPSTRDVEFIVYGWSRRPFYMSGRDAWPLTEPIFERASASREPFWGQVRRGDTSYDVYYMNDRAGIYALGYPLVSAFGHLVTLAELVTLVGTTFVVLLLGGLLYGRVTARTPTSGRALLREVRASFYRKLFLAFVLAAVVPVLALAFVTRAYIASLMQQDIETEAVRTAASASRVVEDFGNLQARGGSLAPPVDDSLVVWLSRVIAQDVNIFDGPDLLASSERNLFASGLLPTRTAGDVYRAIMLEARPSYVMRERVGTYEYLVAAAPVRIQNREAILTVPLTLRQREIEAQSDELDRRVLLAALAFILVGAAIGYSMAERIADPVNRLTRATQRIARGELDARIVATSSDELRRLVEAFNRMAADLQRQRVELERTNRLTAWADMARQVAHDIKNPLTPIQLNAEHLLRVHIDRGRPLGRVLEDCVSNILTQVRLLRQIAGEFSSFASSPTCRPAPTVVASVVDEVLESYRVGLAGRVAIEVHLEENLPLAFVDRTLLGRALTNVIENALHAMPGGGTLRIEAAHEPPDRIRLAVADTGVGMSPEGLSRIFEPYFSTKASGTGLGLTIAKRNVELNGGTIEVESTQGSGTVVTMRLPAVDSTGSSEIAQS
jgi:signal transduction histidine kinase